MQNFKSVSTRKINQQRGTPGVPVWQRNYYDHIIRDQAALQRITAYIQHNPQRWQQDQLHPSRLLPKPNLCAPSQPEIYNLQSSKVRPI